VRIGLLGLLLVGAIWLFRILFPGDEAVIRRQLHDLAAAASFATEEAPLIKVTNAARVAGHFTPTTSIEISVWDRGRFTINSRDEVRQYAFAARNAVASLSVEVSGIEFAEGPADDRATVRLTLGGRIGGRAERETQEMELELTRLEGEWLISRARTVEYLAR
jgi:hypothetical protein